MLFSLLLQHFGEVAQRDTLSTRFIDGITRHLYELTRMSPLHSGQAMADIIYKKYKEFSALRGQRDGRGVFPGLDVVSSLTFYLSRVLKTKKLPPSGLLL
jgi:hypothetical protein